MEHDLTYYDHKRKNILQAGRTVRKKGEAKELGMMRAAAQFLQIQSAKELCAYVKQTFVQMEVVLNEPRYHSFAIPKRQGGKRFLETPMPELMMIQRRLNDGLQAYYALIRPECSHGFVRKTPLATCSIVTNAEAHSGQAYLMNIDLKDFFTTIRASRVRDLFRSDCFCFDEHVSTALALLVTYRGRLPQGAPTSPVISNFVCLSLDERLQAWALKRGANYTRYADDLTFSSDRPFEEEDMIGLRSVIEKEGFTINDRKIRKKGKGRKKTVTGLIVNERVNVDRKLIRKVRAMIYDIQVNGLQQASRRHFGPAVPDTPLSREVFLN
ncbi:MAG: reverse transcriptase family protein, partial [Flavobacteriia bacterium]